MFHITFPLFSSHNGKTVVDVEIGVVSDADTFNATEELAVIQAAVNDSVNDGSIGGYEVDASQPFVVEEASGDDNGTSAVIEIGACFIYSLSYHCLHLH